MSGPHSWAHMFECLFVRERHYLRRHGCGFVDRSVSLSMDFEVSKLHTGLSVVAISVCGSKYSSQLLLQHHACLLIAVLLLNMMRMGQASETVSKHPIRVAVVLVCLHRIRIVTKTMGILCILLPDGYVSKHMYEII